MSAKLAYIAAPYSHDDPKVIAGRMAVFEHVIAELLRSGKWFPVSPLMFHGLVGRHNLAGDWQFWQHYSRRLLARCDALIVTTLPGWEASAGVQGEIALANELSLPIHYHDIWPRQVLADAASSQG